MGTVFCSLWAANVSDIPRLYFILQAEVDTRKRFGGTGLGLLISRNLARAMGGDLELRSDGLGFGCEAIISLPIVVVSSPTDDMKGGSYVATDVPGDSVGKGPARSGSDVGALFSSKRGGSAFAFPMLPRGPNSFEQHRHASDASSGGSLTGRASSEMATSNFESTAAGGGCDGKSSRPVHQTAGFLGAGRLAGPHGHYAGSGSSHRSSSDNGDLERHRQTHGHLGDSRFPVTVSEEQATDPDFTSVTIEDVTLSTRSLSLSEVMPDGSSESGPRPFVGQARSPGQSLTAALNSTGVPKQLAAGPVAACTPWRLRVFAAEDDALLRRVLSMTLGIALVEAILFPDGAELCAAVEGGLIDTYGEAQSTRPLNRRTLSLPDLILMVRDA